MAQCHKKEIKVGPAEALTNEKQKRFILVSRGPLLLL